MAKQTATATDDIRKRIEEIQSSSGTAIRSIEEIGVVIERINGVSQTIAKSVDEQNSAPREIAQRIAETSSGAEVISTGVAQSAQEITGNITSVNEAVRRAASGASETEGAS